MIELKVYVNEKNEACIRCPSCDRRRIVSVASRRGSSFAVAMRCPCGSAFVAAFEWRRCYRKQVHLGGHFFNKTNKREFGEMVVEDISRSGMRFRTHCKHAIDVGSLVKAEFTLDDSFSSKITRHLVVKYVTKGLIGAEFCDSAFEKTLGFYLMP